jgi:predicted phosphoadenosine phosphosulfate sulfurtransferase
MNLEEIKTELSLLDNEEKIKKINEIKLFLHEISPFKNEPVDCVIWEKAENVVANDYNPNKVAPPEMELLKISIQQDGYTQPVVTWEKEKFREVVDGFHRTRVCKEYKEINERVIMYKAGVKLSQQRLCQPYGDDQKKGLWLYHILEPQTWYKLIARVNGANSGAIYIQESGNMTGYNKIYKPENHSWKSYCNFLLATMPKKTREHYYVRFKKFLRSWIDRGYNKIPDEAPEELESKCWAPSWRRLCKVLLRNDYWCKSLGQVQPKSEAYNKFKQLKKENKI